MTYAVYAGHIETPQCCDWWGWFEMPQMTWDQEVVGAVLLGRVFFKGQYGDSVTYTCGHIVAQIVSST